MIFEADDDLEPAAPPPLNPVSAQVLLRACAEEAARLAEAITVFDTDFATWMQDHRGPSGLLQRIDLIRQEASGLASVLRLTAAAPDPDHVIDAETLAGLLQLRAQQERLAG